jgi:hypothetical protein
MLNQNHYVEEFSLPNAKEQMSEHHGSGGPKMGQESNYEMASNIDPETMF